MTFPSLSEWIVLTEREYGSQDLIIKYQKELAEHNRYIRCILAINALLDTTETSDVQDVGGKPLAWARALAEKALIGD